MTLLFELSTAYVIASILFLVMPLATWLTLSSERQNAIPIWCLGGCLFGLGLFLLGLRIYLPEWATYPLGNFLVWFSALMMVKAMQRELERDLPWRQMIVVTLLMVFIFEYLRLVCQCQTLRFSWSVMITLVLFGWISWLGFLVRDQEGCRSAYWLLGAYILATVGLLYRLVRTWAGHADPDIIIANVDGVITSFTSLILAIFGNMGYIGIYLSRAHSRETLATVERERQEIQAQLGAQIAHLDRQRSLSEMSAALAHELGQPLTAAEMDCHVANTELGRWPSAPLELKETLASLGENIVRAGSIVTRIHDFILQREPELKPVQWFDVYQDVISLIPKRERPALVNLSWRSTRSDLWILGDRIQLSQVLLNLLRNALQASKTSEVLHLEVFQQVVGDDIVLTVQDNGCGMAPEIINQIGSAFFSTKPDGLGVGFSISRTIVQHHGGQMQIESEVGHGTKVRVILPRMQT